MIHETESPPTITGLPPSGSVHDEREIEAVLDYIKSTWPQREADYQRRISNG
jgi:hypothetical protein